jgi:hypothetical protein
MIVGTDLLHDIGLDLIFSKAEMIWDNASVPMQSIDMLSVDWIEQLEQEIMFAYDPVTTDAERIQSIIDAKYTKADLPTIAKECELLSPEE